VSSIKALELPLLSDAILEGRALRVLSGGVQKRAAICIAIDRKTS